MSSRSPDAANEQEFVPINEDPRYDAIWEEAKRLVPEWIPWEFADPPRPSQGSWGLGFGSISRGFRENENPDKHYLWLSSMKRQGLGTLSAPLTDAQIKATAIGLLMYVAADEARRERE